MDRKATIYDIAHTAGVSPATVSRVIHQPDLVTEKTRQKVLQAFETHKIAPEDLSSKKRLTASTRPGGSAGQNILVSLPTIENPFYHEIVDAIRDCLQTNHYHMIITTETPLRSSIHSFLNYCSTLQIAGIIIMYPLTEDFLRQLSAAYPLVQCSEYNPFYQNVPYVSIDDYAVAKAAVAHLVRAGCRRVGFFSVPFEYRFVQNRYRAYQSILTGSNMTVRPEYVVQVSDFSYDRILAAAEQFFRLPEPPDGVFAVSDEHAHAVVNAAEKTGFRVPEDVKVFGFDNTLYSKLATPAISTVAQPMRELGFESAQLLLKIIKNPNVRQESRILPAHLIIRESTGSQSFSST